MKTLEDLFLDELADMYDAENRLTKALPKMARAARHEALRHAFEDHLVETEGHLRMLKEVFKALGETARGKQCEAIVGLLKEGEEIAEDNEGEETINAALICAAQKVEHYEIATYGCLHEWARLLENAEAAEILARILDQEKAVDQKLTTLAREACNPQADQAEQAAPNGKPDRQAQRDMEAEGGIPPVALSKGRTVAGPKARIPAGPKGRIVAGPKVPTVDGEAGPRGRRPVAS